MLHSQQYTGLEYIQLLSFPQWKVKRAQILLRDDNKCRSCGSTNFLQVHHRQYHIFKNTMQYKTPWDYDSKLLITLCNSCHIAGHQKYSVPVFIIN